MSTDNGLLVYTLTEKGVGNIGDYVQSLAAQQYFTSTEKFIHRDYLNKSLEKKTKLIMNGWFTYHPENWPPHENIDPLFVSFHLDKNYEKDFFTKDTIEYLNKYAPIGCRDFATLSLMKKYNIDAYYSSCLTTTLNRELYENGSEKDGIYFVDVLYRDDLEYKWQFNKRSLLKDVIKGKWSIKNTKNILYQHFPKELVDSGEILTQAYKSKDIHTDNSNVHQNRLNIASDLLKKLCNAKLVITSRIHIALPCLAFGTPVLFVYGGDLTKEADNIRFMGTIDHLNVLYIGDQPIKNNKLNVYTLKDIDFKNPPKNPSSHIEFKDALIKKCQAFVNAR